MKKIIFTLFAATFLLPISLLAESVITTVHTMAHVNWPMRYASGEIVEKFERFFLVFYTPTSGDTFDIQGGRAVPFVLTRDYQICPVEGASADTLYTYGKDVEPGVMNVPYYFMGTEGYFSGFEYDSHGKTGITSDIFGITNKVIRPRSETYTYVVVTDSRTVPNGDGTFSCPVFDPKNFSEVLGKTHCINGYQVFPAGILPSSSGPAMPGLNDMYIAFTTELTQDGWIPDAFYNDYWYISNRMQPDATINPLSIAKTSMSLPKTIAGESNPTKIAEMLTPSFTTVKGENVSDISVTLPGVAQGLMRYSVYTTTDLSTWTLLDDVPDVNNLKKRLAPNSGMSYTLINVEDPTGLSIVLPKIGEKRFYRVVGE